MDNYRQEILNWQQERDTDLRAENSWLALTGLFWLEEGRNTFGVSEQNDLIFPDVGIPAQVGAFIVDGENVRLEVTTDTLVDVDGVPAKEGSLQPDISGAPTQLKLGSLTFILIKREDGFGIRLWDSGSPKRESFAGRQWYIIDEAYRIEGRYERFSAENIVSFTRKNGADFEAQVHGEVCFNLNGEDFALIAFEDPDEGDLFIMFRDTTNGNETYGSGRYLSVVAPKNGMAIIDFNRAVNPPCAFTSYATCPLPPVQNHLPVEIPAGEKKTLA